MRTIKKGVVLALAWLLGVVGFKSILGFVATTIVLSILCTVVLKVMYIATGGVALWTMSAGATAAKNTIVSMIIACVAVWLVMNTIGLCLCKWLGMISISFAGAIGIGVVLTLFADFGKKD